MQSTSPQMLAILRAEETRARDLLVVYELYDPGYDGSGGFDPAKAIARFSGEGYVLPYGPLLYKRLVKKGPSVKKRRGKEANSTSVTFSNVDRFIAGFTKQYQVEQMRLVVRLVSRSVAAAIGNTPAVLSSTPVLFVGRCQTPDDFDRAQGTISATPDLGTIEAQIPPRRHQGLCPLDFKGTECLGGETIDQKTLEYKQAVRCDFTKEQCTFYGNESKFQGNAVVQVQSSFIHKSHRGFLSKLVNVVSFGLLAKRRVVPVSNSIHDGTPLGEVIAVILGRWKKKLQMLEYQDIGTSINWKGAAGRGPISDFLDVVNESPSFTQPLGVAKHLGEYGGIGTQTEDTVFPEPAYHSRLAYATGYCNGTDIETEDAAPEIAALVAGIVPDEMYFDTNHSGTGQLATGTGGVSLAGGRSTTIPHLDVSFDDVLFESGFVEAYWKFEETAFGPSFPTPPGGIEDFSGNGHHAWYNDFATGGTVLDISTPEVPVQTDPASRFVSGGVGGLSAPVGGALDLVGDQTWVAIARMTSHGAQSYIINRGTDTAGGVPFALSFGDGLGTQTIYATWGNGAIGGGRLSSGPIVVADGRPYLIVTTRRQNTICLYVNGCLVDRRDDFVTGDIIFADYNNSAWRFGYTPNLVFGPVWTSQGLSRIALIKTEWSENQVQRLWGAMRTMPSGCPAPDWTDNPVDQTRYILTDPALLNNPEINDQFSAYAAAYCTGAVRDESNAERVLLPSSEVTKAGVDYKRYTSTGLLGPKNFDASRTQIPAGVPDRTLENVGAGLHGPGQYEFYDPAAPPAELPVKKVYRKRFTNNVQIDEPLKAVDFLYDRLFTTFRGFLWWDDKGRTVIDCERPADETELLSEAQATDGQLEVQDATHWKTILGSPYLLEGQVLIGPSGGAKSEIREVTLAEWSTAGNSITLEASASGGPTATASGATLSGGSPTVRAEGTVVIGGSLVSGATITVVVNGFACVLDLVTGEGTATIAQRMAAVINASPEVNGLVEANGDDTGVVTLLAKCGTLTLSAPLEEDHDTAVGDPSSPPAATAVPGGSMLPGIYLLGYSYVNDNGQTLVSVLLPVTLGAGQRISVEDMTPLPPSANSVNWFLSRSPNDTDLGFVVNNNGTAFFINTLPEPGAKGDAVANETGTLVTRVMMSFSGKAATWANVARSNIIDGSFSWPDAKRQGFINQVKSEWREAVRDFAKQPGAVNDFPSQRKTRKQSPYEMDLSGVDNTNQAARLMNGKLNQFTEGKDFYKWGSAGEAVLLVEGDVVAVSHDAGNPPFRNVLVRVEDWEMDPRREVTLNCRKYSRLQYDDTSAVKAGVVIERALTSFRQPPPAIAFDTAGFPPGGLQQSTDGVAGITSVRGGVVFGASPYAQYGKIRLVVRAGVPVDESVRNDLAPNAQQKDVFEFVASAEGLYVVEARACNQWGCSTAVTASIAVVFGSQFALTQEDADPLTQEDADYLEREH